MISTYFLYIPFLWVVLAQHEQEDVELPLLRTRNGLILGRLVESYGNLTGYVFEGIPHAKPPVGELRFKAAVPAPPWKGILDARQYKLPCIANPIKTYKNTIGGPVSEDCLYVNVFSSATCIKKGGCAVMAVLHGGAFTFESPVILKEECIVNNFANEDRNIVVVTVPYRLGTLGLFNLSPGLKTSQDSNLGLRDVIFALQWIQQQIHSFGGNKNRVTLFGHSAGAIIANLISLSPMSVGLFHQIVDMSGPLVAAADFSKGTSSRFSQAMAVKLGCSKENEEYNELYREEQILKCMRSKPADEILAAQISMNWEAEGLYRPNIDGAGGVLPDYIENLMKTRRPVNILTGTLAGEMRDARNAANAKGEPIMERLTELTDHLAYLFNYEKPGEFKKEFLKYYGRVNVTQFIDDDIAYYVGTINTANSLVDKGKVFVYSYSYTGAGEAFDKYYNRSYGPTHSEDYIYFFGVHRKNFTTKDYEIERIYTGMVANFVKNSDPSSEGKKWNPWKKGENSYFHIDFDENLKMPGMKSGYYKEAEEFWNGILPRTAGKWTPLEYFPAKLDVITQEIMDPFSTHWTGDGFGSEKNAVGLRKQYTQWAMHLPKLKAARKAERKKLAAAIEGQHNYASNFILMGSACLLILGAFVILIKKNSRRNDGYEILK